MLEELHKLWKHHAAHLEDLHQRKENPTEQNHNNIANFEIGQPVMLKKSHIILLNPNIYWTTRY